jgi:hypothetical protein
VSGRNQPTPLRDPPIASLALRITVNDLLTNSGNSD